MTVPIPDIVKKLVERKYLRTIEDKWSPQTFRKIIPIPVRDMILKYRTILRGFLNYFSFVDNIKQLGKIHWILWESLRKTICRKLDISKSIFFQQFGKDIALKVRKKDGTTTILDFPAPKLVRDPDSFSNIERLGDPLASRNWKISTIAALGQPCSNCGSGHKVEMHHLKHIRTINLKLSGFDSLMARINRKQVPLCQPCHARVHKGEHQGMSIHYFKHLKWEGEGK